MKSEIDGVSLKLKKYRKIHGLTQERVAEVISVEPNYYATIENGHRNITLQKLILLCKFYNITLNDIIEFPINEDDCQTKKQWIDEICVDLQKLSLEDVGRFRAAIRAIIE